MGRKKKKTTHLGLRIAVVVLAVLLVLMLAVAALMHYVMNRIGRYADQTQPTGETEPVTDFFETNETKPDESVNEVAPEDVVWQEVETITGDNVINILLIGQDARPGEGRARSDSMILVSLNKKSGTIQLTSFMRDLYVQIPGYQDNRINAAFAYEGPELLNEVLEVNFGVEVDGNVEVNFEGFEAVIDILGGVDVEMTAEEANYLQWAWGYGVEGMNHLNGEQALYFSRMRNLSGSDYTRTDRQRRVIASVINSLRTSNPATIAQLVNEVLPHVTTDLTDWEIIQYATLGISALAGGSEIQSARIPAEDAHYSAYIRGMAVLVPDLEMCREDLQEFIYGTTSGETEPGE